MHQSTSKFTHLTAVVGSPFTLHGRHVRTSNFRDKRGAACPHAECWGTASSGTERMFLALAIPPLGLPSRPGAHRDEIKNCAGPIPVTLRQSAQQRSRQIESESSRELDSCTQRMPGQCEIFTTHHTAFITSARWRTGRLVAIKNVSCVKRVKIARVRKLAEKNAGRGV